MNKKYFVNWDNISGREAEIIKKLNEQDEKSVFMIPPITDYVFPGGMNMDEKLWRPPIKIPNMRETLRKLYAACLRLEDLKGRKYPIISEIALRRTSAGYNVDASSAALLESFLKKAWPNIIDDSEPGASLSEIEAIMWDAAVDMTAGGMREYLFVAAADSPHTFNHTHPLVITDHKSFSNESLLPGTSIHSAYFPSVGDMMYAGGHKKGATPKKKVNFDVITLPLELRVLLDFIKSGKSVGEFIDYQVPRDCNGVVVGTRTCLRINTTNHEDKGDLCSNKLGGHIHFLVGDN